MYVWDDFYYESTSQKLLTTDYMIVGNQSLQSTQFDITIFKEKQIGADTGKKVLGVSYDFQEAIKDKVHFGAPEMNLNDEYKLGLKSEFVDRNVVFKFKIDYT